MPMPGRTTAQAAISRGVDLAVPTQPTRGTTTAITTIATIIRAMGSLTDLEGEVRPLGLIVDEAPNKKPRSDSQAGHSFSEADQSRTSGVCGSRSQAACLSVSHLRL